MKLLRAAQVVEKVGFSKNTLYRQIKAGKFPVQIQITENRTGWLESEIDAWIQERVDAPRGI